MIAKLLKIVKEKFNKISSNSKEERESNAETLDRPFLQFVIQVDDVGDFAIGAECYSTETKNAPFLGTLLYFINSGMLSDYFVEALRLCSEGDEPTTKFMMKSMESWKEIYDTEIEMSLNSEKDAVDPKDVFSFYKMRP